MPSLLEKQNLAFDFVKNNFSFFALPLWNQTVFRSFAEEEPMVHALTIEMLSALQNINDYQAAIIGRGNLDRHNSLLYSNEDRLRSLLQKNEKLVEVLFAYSQEEKLISAWNCWQKKIGDIMVPKQKPAAAQAAMAEKINQLLSKEEKRSLNLVNSLSYQTCLETLENANNFCLAELNDSDVYRMKSRLAKSAGISYLSSSLEDDEFVYTQQDSEAIEKLLACQAQNIFLSEGASSSPLTHHPELNLDPSLTATDKKLIVKGLFAIFKLVKLPSSNTKAEWHVVNLVFESKKEAMDFKKTFSNTIFKDKVLFMSLMSMCENEVEFYLNDTNADNNVYDMMNNTGMIVLNRLNMYLDIENIPQYFIDFDQNILDEAELVRLNLISQLPEVNSKDQVPLDIHTENKPVDEEQKESQQAPTSLSKY